MRASVDLIGHEPFGEAEVADVRAAFGVDENVRRLEVAMEHALLVGLGDRAGDRARAGARLRDRGSGPSARRSASVVPRT